MMVTVVFLFAVCWAPFHVIHMMIEYSEYLPCVIQKKPFLAFFGNETTVC